MFKTGKILFLAKGLETGHSRMITVALPSMDPVHWLHTGKYGIGARAYEMAISRDMYIPKSTL